MTTVEPTHTPVLVGTNPVTYVWLPICKCWLNRYYDSADAYCPVHGYPTVTNPMHLLPNASVAIKNKAVGYLQVVALNPRPLDVASAISPGGCFLTNPMHLLPDAIEKKAG